MDFWREFGFIFIVVTSKMVEDYKEELERNASMGGRKDVDAIFIELKKIFSFIYKNGGIKIDPSKGIDAPKPPKRVKKKAEEMAFTSEQVETILNVCQVLPECIVKSTKQTAVFLALVTGMRMGEVLALEWDDLELDRLDDDGNGKVYVGKTLVRAHKFIQSHTKGKEDREIPLFPKAVELLRKFRSQQMKCCQESGISPKSHVFARIIKHSKQTEWYRGDDINHFLKGFCSRHGLPPKSSHKLRHSFATFLLSIKQGKVGVAEISKLLGHKSMEITLGVYHHIFKDQLKETVSPFQDIMDPF